MEFRLFYRGELKANRGSVDKHELRKRFHPQLRDLFSQAPLAQCWYLIDQASSANILFSVSAFTFAPLVNERMKSIAALDILFLRPEAPGAIITKGGDIDNRLKTLLDALKMPHEPNALPPGSSPAPDETPFFCLLQDDNLITDLRVTTDRLLEPVNSPSEVVLIIRVRTSVTELTRGNGVFA